MFEVGTPPYPLCQILAVCPSWTNLLSIYHILTAFSYDVALSRGKPVVSMSMTIPILSIIPSNRKENWCQRYYTLWEQDTPSQFCCLQDNIIASFTVLTTSLLMPTFLAWQPVGHGRIQLNVTATSQHIATQFQSMVTDTLHTHFS